MGQKQYFFQAEGQIKSCQVIPCLHFGHDQFHRKVVFLANHESSYSLQGRNKVHTLKKLKTKYGSTKLINLNQAKRDRKQLYEEVLFCNDYFFIIIATITHNQTTGQKYLATTSQNNVFKCQLIFNIFIYKPALLQLSFHTI